MSAGRGLSALAVLLARGLVEHDVRHDLDRRLVALRTEADEADGLSHLPVDLLAGLDVLHEELPGVLATLAELLTLVGEPGAGLLDHLQVDAHVQERSLGGDAL